MFPHEELLAKALNECRISALVHDLAGIYSDLAIKAGTEEDFAQTMQIRKILLDAAEQIADLGAKPNLFN